MSGHLGAQLSDYVDRRLPPARLAELDRHLVACQVCRADADQERVLLRSMRSDAVPAPSAGLQQLLLGLGATPPRPAAPSAGAAQVPLMPTPLAALRLPVVPPSAPALHRSARRATILAGLAASASAAVAWALTAPAAPASVERAPTTWVRSPASGSVVQAAFLPGSVESFTRGKARTPQPPEHQGR